MESTNLISEEVAGTLGGTMPDHLNSSSPGENGQESQDGVDDGASKEKYWKKRFSQATWDMLRSPSPEMVDENIAPFPIMRPQEPSNDKKDVERIPWTMNLPVMFPAKRVKGLIVRAPELIDIADDEDDIPIEVATEVIDVPDDEEKSSDGTAVDFGNDGVGEEESISQESPTSGLVVVATSKSTNELTMFQQHFEIASTLGPAVDILNGGDGEEESRSQESPTTDPVVVTSESTNELELLRGVTDDSTLLSGLDLNILDIQSDTEDWTGMPHSPISDNLPSHDNDKNLDHPTPILQAAQDSTVTMAQHSAPETSIAEETPSTSRVIIPSIKKAKLDNGCPKNLTTSSSIQQPKAKLAVLFKACQPKRKPKVRRGKKSRAASSISKPQPEATTQPETKIKETINQPLLKSKPETVQHVEVKVPVPRRQRRSCISPDVTITTLPPKKTQKPGKAAVQQSTSTFKGFKVAMMAYLQDMRTKPRQSMTVASFTSRAKGVAVRIGFDYKTFPADWIQDLQNQYSNDFFNYGIDHLAAPPIVRASRKRKQIY